MKWRGRSAKRAIAASGIFTPGVRARPSFFDLVSHFRQQQVSVERIESAAVMVAVL